MPVVIDTSTGVEPTPVSGRQTFPNAEDRLVYSIEGGSDFRPSVGRKVRIYSDAAGTVLADIQNPNGTPVANSELTVDANSLLPTFLGPDGIDTLYAKGVGDSATSEIHADTDSRLDSLQTSLSAIVTGSGFLTPQAASAIYSARLGGTSDDAAAQPFLNVKDFGAINDGIFDNTGAIASCFAAASAIGGTIRVIFPAGGSYRTTGPLIAVGNVDVEMYSPIIYDGPSPQTGPALTVGAAAGGADTGAKHRLWVERAIRSWASPLDIGIRLNSLYQSQIEIVEARRFHTGVQCRGDSGSGFTYNTVYIDGIRDCKIALQGTNINEGWFNQNTIIGGRISVSSNTDPGVERIGWQITSEDGLYPNNNANVWLNPSFELNDATVGLPLDFVYATYNRVIGMRTESNSSTVARVSNNSDQNRIDYGFVSGNPVVSHVGAFRTTITSSGRLADSDSTRLVFASGPIARLAYEGDGAGALGVPGLSIIASSASTKSRFLSGLTLTADHLDISGSRGIGLFIDTSKIKRFAVRPSLTSGGCRVSVQAFSTAGVVLTSADAGHPFIIGQPSSLLSYTSSFGGAYRVGTDSAADQFFTVGPEVGSVFVFIAGGTASALLRSFSIWTGDPGDAPFYSSYRAGRFHAQRYASAIPLTGTYERGEILWNISPVAGGTVGWVCVTAGTPGTWKTFGTISA